MNIKTAERLLEYRKANGFSQEELAEKIGVSRQAISKWERCESSPDTDNLIALARLYNVSIDELINGSDIKSAAKADEPEEKRDKVDIGLHGIHVESKDGDSVHIDGINGIHINSDGKKSHYAGRDEKNPWLDTLLPIFAVAFYLLVGFTSPRGWAAGWIVFLFIPIIQSAYSAVKTKNPSRFSYPVLAAAIYLISGMCFMVWHPTWIIFISIPAYYALCDTYKKTRKSREDDFSGYSAASSSGTYYTPDISEQQSRNKSGSRITTIIITVICALVVTSCVAITCVFGFLGNVFDSDFMNEIISLGGNLASIADFDYDDSEYSIGSGTVDANLINEISIEWLSNNIEVIYYDGDSIAFSEPEQKNSNLRMRYCIDGDELKLKYCKSGRTGKSGHYTEAPKNLTLMIPNGKELREIDIESISANIKLDGINTAELSASTVSGNINAGGNFGRIQLESVSGEMNAECTGTPRKIDIETVSGSAVIYLPDAEDESGFKINSSTVSGTVSSDFEGYDAASKSYGRNPETQIEFDSVSGCLRVNKAA